MAEMRIPTDRIPLDILQRLQAIGQSIMFPGVAFTTSSSTAGTTESTAASYVSPTSSAASSTTSSTMPFFALSSATVNCTSASPLKSPPSSQASSSLLSSYLSKTTKTEEDEVDGGGNDTIVHVLEPVQPRRMAKDVLDDSGIVRVFAMDGDPGHDDTTYPIKTESEIVRIFPDKKLLGVAKEPSAQSMFHSSGTHTPQLPLHLDCVRNIRKASTSSINPWTSGSSNDNYPPSFVSTTPSAQNHDQVIGASSSIKPPVSPRALLEQADFTYNRTTTTTTTASCSTASHSTRKCSPPPPPPPPPPQLIKQVSPRLRDPAYTSARGDVGHGLTRQSPAISVTCRRSPDLPTPPQTPDDGELGDDEVFTYDGTSCLDLGSKRRAIFDTCRYTNERTPRRENSNLRHNSDRSLELRHHVAQQVFSEPTCGDRQRSRKRLSFEEEDVIRPSLSRPSCYSEPLAAIMSTSSDCALPASSGNGLSSQSSAFHKCRSATHPLLSPTHNLHIIQPAPSTSCSRPATVDSTPHNKQPIVSHAQSEPSPQRHSPVGHVMRMLDRVSRHKSSALATPSTHSQSQYATDGHLDWSSEKETPSSLMEAPAPSRHAISYAKRRRLDSSESAEVGGTLTSQLELIPSPDLSEDCGGLCACAKIERNFLQMAEGAYKRIRRMDATQSDFDRFRQELAQTNDILRASLDIMKNIKSMCEHRLVTPFTSSSSQR